MASPTSDPVVGQQLAHYKIEDKLGQGGMGAVYRAWDVNLRRPVALKLLADSRERTGPARTRFQMEARSAAALNHPNIVTIYEIGQSGGVDFIAMELVEGQTLRHVIGRQPMPVDRVLDYGAQIADAVAAAHAAGVTHRDLKPANIMVTPKGRLKVLDFGIAKRTGAGLDADHTLTANPGLTLPGAPMGTPNYMSPEQAEGKPVDGRSDIFALGAILFEMLTGRRAFPGDSYAAVMAGILKTDPPPVSSLQPVPPELDRLVQRCLRKDVDRRFQHAGDLKIALEELKGETSASLPSLRTAAPATLDPNTPTLLPVTPTTPGHTLHTMLAQPAQRNWMLGVAAFAALLGAGGVYWFFTRPQPPAPFADAALHRITADAGLAQEPALSRDGKFIAYASDRGQDNLQIWVQQISGGAPIQLTSGPFDNSDPQFSPDGSQILFRSERDGGGLYLAPALGGEARLVAKFGAGGRFSPVGHSISFSTGRASGLERMFVLNLRGAATPRAILPNFNSAYSPIWSPDGKRLLFRGSRVGGFQADPWADDDWWIVNADGSGEASSTGILRRLAQRKFVADNPAAWLSGDRIVFAAERQASRSLWMMKLPANGEFFEPVRMTFGTTVDQHPAVAPDPAGGEQVAFSSVEKNLDIWTLPIDGNRGVVTGAMSKLTEGAGSRSSQLSMSGDGHRIAFFSNRGGRMVPWIWDLVSNKQSSLSTPGAAWTPQISHDGRAVAWCLIEQNQMKRLFRAPIGADLEVGLPDAICEDCGPAIAWSPDNRILTYAHGNPSRTAALEVATGRRYDLLAHPKLPVWGGRFSSDGRWLTFNTTEPLANSRIYIARFDPERRAIVPPEEWIPVTDGSAWDDKTRWSPDGNAIYFVSERDGFRCVYRQPLDPATKRPNGPAKSLIHLHQARRSMNNVTIGLLAFQVAQDRLIFSLSEVTGNIWLLKKPD